LLSEAMISWADSNPTCSTPEIIGFAGAAARVKNRFCASAMRRLSSAAPQSALRFLIWADAGAR
jgi:hypothetical protein